MSAYDFDRNLEAKQARRMHAEDRFLARQEKREAEAAALVGELNSGRFYINVKNRHGRMTGRIVEFASEADAVAYLLRNNYV